MESVKKFLEKEGEMAITMDGLPEKFFEPFIMKGIQVDLLELGPAILTIGTPSFGVSVEINVSYLDSAYPGEERLRPRLYKLGRLLVLPVLS
ncbi:unnamed protein product [Prunus brigantina]